MRALRYLSGLILLVLLAAGAQAEEPAWIDLYTGYATPTGGQVVGRVHYGTPPRVPLPGESSAHRVLQTIDALDTQALAGVPVVITVAGKDYPVRTGRRGYIDLALPIGLQQPMVRVSARLAAPGYTAAPVTIELPVYDGQPGLAVISDVDDTLLDTGVIHKLRMIGHVLTRSSWELHAFPGAAPVVTALAQGLPLVYISGSPWGLLGRIRDYFRRSGFPEAPFILKRFSSEPLTDQMAYKWPHVLAFADALPLRRLILLGDSSEKDPEVYARLRRERPGRVAGIYIHLVTQEEPGAPRFQGMTVFREWSEIDPKRALQ